MKTPNSLRPLIFGTVLGTITMIVTTLGCSSKPKPPAIVNKPQPVSFAVRPEAPKSVAFTASQPAPMLAVAKQSKTDKVQPKSIAYKSRDYGVSFEYPWQYTRLGAKAIADNYSLQPQSDGLDSQLTLVRIDVPKGFYPDTDFNSAYFTLSLNPDLSEKECQSTLNAGKDNKPQTVTINGVDFRWMETDSGGHGESAKVRNYVTFANSSCYELETGVKTKNNGLAREINPDQVMRRLDAILTTVKIGPTWQSPAKLQLQSSAQTPASDPGK